MNLDESLRTVIREEIINAFKEINQDNSNIHPVILKAEHIADILGCSKRIAYELMDRKEFPLIKIGRLKRVNKNEFYNWLEQNKKIT